MSYSKAYKVYSGVYNSKMTSKQRNWRDIDFNIEMAITWASQGRVMLAKLRLESAQEEASKTGFEIPKGKLDRLSLAYKYGIESSLGIARINAEEEFYEKAQVYLKRAKDTASEIGLDISERVSEIEKIMG